MLSRQLSVMDGQLNRLGVDLFIITPTANVIFLLFRANLKKLQIWNYFQENERYQV